LAEQKKTVKKKRKMTSAQKQAKQGKARRLRNTAALSRIRKISKKLMSSGDQAKGLLPQAYAEIDKAARTGVIHRRNAARQKSRLARLAK
jgi:small subunit ribosomal protein S20